MTNGIVGLPIVAGPVNAPSGDARLDEETGQASFASLFAGAAQALAQPPIPLVQKPEGTSELDASSDTENTEDTGDTDDVGEADKSDPAPNGIDRSISALDPALQERLGRVMARMREETGHEVQVGETYRSQSRQNALYAQGRSDPGPVVTWTQSSKHTQGRAVDLLVDGGSAGSDAYAALRRIATQEGLRTLGERDPGHLELPANLARTVTDMTTAATAPTTATVATDAATVARVAKVETPANVARVATVARPGVASSVTRVPTTQHTAPASTQGQPIAGQTSAGNQQSGANPEERSQKNTGDRDGTGYGAAYGVGRRAGSEFTLPNVVASTSVGASAAHRAADIMATREDAPARPLSQIVMAVDAGNGTTDRIQLDLRGSSLNATIDAGDQRAAHTMDAHKSELVRTLTRDGLDVESLEIRATTAAAPAAAESTHRSSDSSSNSRSERGGQWQQQQNRQRSENERRQHQRDERGGKK